MDGDYLKELQPLAKQSQPAFIALKMVFSTQIASLRGQEQVAPHLSQKFLTSTKLNEKNITTNQKLHFPLQTQDYNS